MNSAIPTKLPSSSTLSIKTSDITLDRKVQETMPSMSFEVFDVSTYESERARELAQEGDLVESGLSSGEVRQALLDRFRSEVKREDRLCLNLTLKPYGLFFEEDELEDEVSRRSILMDIENLLYDMSDEQLDNSLWEFSDELILVRGEP